jgi:NAD-dependent dihydropyrimidine dehydrogenase PreA subunit
MTYVIAEPCIDVKDKSCVEECPVDCIYAGERMLYIHPDECVDCGACEPLCPVEVIFYEDDVPEQWSAFTAENAKFFDQLGSPAAPPKPTRCRTTPTMSPATSSPAGNVAMARRTAAHGAPPRDR